MQKGISLFVKRIDLARNLEDENSLQGNQNEIFRGDPNKQVKVVSITGKEFTNSGAKQDLLNADQLDKLIIVNQDTGWSVIIRKRHVKHETRFRTPDATLRAIVALPQLIQESVLVSQRPDKKGHLFINYSLHYKLIEIFIMRKLL